MLESAVEFFEKAVEFRSRSALLFHILMIEQNRIVSYQITVMNIIMLITSCANLVGLTLIYCFVHVLATSKNA